MKFDNESLCKEIEKGFELGESTTSAYAVTGEPYVTLGWQINGRESLPGTVDECEKRELGFDAETAYWGALSAFRAYAEDRKGKLYWRAKPTLEWSEDGKHCLFWARCLISDRPALPKQEVA